MWEEGVGGKAKVPQINNREYVTEFYNNDVQSSHAGSSLIETAYDADVQFLSCNISGVSGGTALMRNYRELSLVDYHGNQI